MKVFFLAFLLLAGDALAVRLVMSGRFNNNGAVSNTLKNVKNPISDSESDHIEQNIGTLSGGRFGASKNTDRNILTVFNNEPAASKGVASGINQEMQSFVNGALKDFRSVADTVENII